MPDNRFICEYCHKPYGETETVCFVGDGKAIHKACFRIARNEPVWHDRFVALMKRQNSHA